MQSWDKSVLVSVCKTLKTLSNTVVDDILFSTFFFRETRLGMSYESSARESERPNLCGSPYGDEYFSIQ